MPTVPRCQVTPLADHQATFSVDGSERLRWHFGPNYPRPFFYPLIGPSGAALTRMGHPGAPDHDHHRSIWFGHEKVLGINFWTDRTTAHVQQKQWLAYQDGDDEAVMATLLGWYDGHDPKELLTQELIVAVRPLADRETLVELQSTFTPIADSLEFGKTNFGFLAVRVAKSISTHFGGGEITNSEGATGEAATFGKPARWMDYSGPVVKSFAGITLFDHPSNIGYPSLWHTRDDGWMGPSVCRNEPRVTTKAKPLTLRYFLHAHAGKIDAKRANTIAEEFSALAPHRAQRVKGHTQYRVARDERLKAEK